MVKKIEQIQLNNQQNKKNVDTLQRYNIVIAADTFNKRLVEIPLLTNFLIPKWIDLNQFIEDAYNDDEPFRPFPVGSLVFEFDFNGLPDWAIPMIKVLPLFSMPDSDWIISGQSKSLDDYPQLNNGSNYNFNYFWEKKDNKNYKLYVSVWHYVNKGYPSYTDMNLTIDLSAWFVNTNFRNTLQHNLSKY